MSLGHPNLIFLWGALSHQYFAKSRNTAAEALELYNSASSSVRNHLFVKTLLTGLGRRQLELYANADCSLEELPFLHCVICKAMFVQVVERWSESRHALVS